MTFCSSDVLDDITLNTSICYGMYSSFKSPLSAEEKKNLGDKAELSEAAIDQPKPRWINIPSTLNFSDVSHRNVTDVMVRNPINETCVSKYLLSTWVPVVVTWNGAVLVLCAVALDAHADSSNQLSEADFKWLKNDQNYTLYCKDPAMYLYYYMDQSKASGRKFIVDMKQVGHILNVANTRSTKRALTGIKLEDSKDVLFLKKLSEKEQVSVLRDKILDIIKSIDPKMTKINRWTHFKDWVLKNSYHSEVEQRKHTTDSLMGSERGNGTKRQMR